MGSSSAVLGLVGTATVLATACTERGRTPTGPAVVARTAAAPAAATPSLRAAAAAKGRFYGCAVGGSLFSDGAFGAAAAAECGMLVPENALKWGPLRPTPTTYDFSLADRIADFAAANGMALRGHTLVWHNSLPAWFATTVNSGNAERYLVEHIATVAGRYRGRMHSWDVVNEAIDLASPRPDKLRLQPWLALLGPGYLETAFRAAHAADPGALLVYNDYGIESDGAQQDAKRRATLALLDGLLATGTPVHALGLQMHIGEGAQFTALPGFLAQVKARGLVVLITELDVTESTANADPAVIDRAVAGAYQRALAAVFADPVLTQSVLTWGLSDRYTWLNTSSPRPDGARRRPLPLDTQMQHKLAWQAMMEVFGALPSPTTPLLSRASGKCMDVLGAGHDAGTPFVIYPCHGGENQRFTLPSPGSMGEVRVYGALCLDAESGNGNDGDRIVAWPCHGGVNQQWTLTAAGEIRGINGKCVDVAGAATADLTGLILWPCHGGSNQQWDRAGTGAAVARLTRP